MANHYLDCAAKTKGLGGSKKLVLMALADSAAGDTRISSPGLGEIMEWAETKKSYTMRLIGQLIEDGLVERHSTGYPGHTAEYIVFPHGCCATHGPLHGRRKNGCTPVHPQNGSTAGVDPNPVDNPKNGSTPAVDPNVTKGSTNGSTPAVDPYRSSKAFPPTPSRSAARGADDLDNHEPQNAEPPGLASPNVPEPAWTDLEAQPDPPVARPEPPRPALATDGACNPANPPHRNCRSCGTSPRSATAKRREDSTRTARELREAELAARAACTLCDDQGWLHDREPAERHWHLPQPPPTPKRPTADADGRRARTPDPNMLAGLLPDAPDSPRYDEWRAPASATSNR